MSAINMAGTVAPNPSLGKTVAMDPFSGPKGSPKDAKVYPTNVWPPVIGSAIVDVNNQSTGALSTGIGFDLNAKSGGINPNDMGPVNWRSGFDYAEQPGLTMPSLALAPDARLLAIGGGRSGPATVANGGAAPTTPWNAQPILAFGNGGSRDAGAGPAFTGFGMRMSTAAAAAAPGAVIEAGYTNRSTATIPIGAAGFGSTIAASPAPA
jgi:hypothetical protein